MGLLRNAQDIFKETTYIPTYPENTTFSSIEANKEGKFYILVPLGMLFGISILALLVYLMASYKRSVFRLYCKKRNDHRFLYEYDSPLEQEPDVAEEEEDEVDNEDNPTKSLLRGKLQINNRYENYLSTSHLNCSSSLFT